MASSLPASSVHEIEQDLQFGGGRLIWVGIGAHLECNYAVVSSFFDDVHGPTDLAGGLCLPWLDILAPRNVVAV